MGYGPAVDAKRHAIFLVRRWYFKRQ
jgi:hypothetical protein